MKEAPTVKKHPQKTLETKKYQTFTHSRKQLAQANQNQTNKDKTQQGKDKNNARTKCKSERIRLNTANAVIDTTQESLSENSRAPLRK